MSPAEPGADPANPPPKGSRQPTGPDGTSGRLAARRVAEKCGFVLLGQQGGEYQFRRDLSPKRPI